MVKAWIACLLLVSAAQAAPAPVYRPMKLHPIIQSLQGRWLLKSDCYYSREWAPFTSCTYYLNCKDDKIAIGGDREPTDLLRVGKGGLEMRTSYWHVWQPITLHVEGDHLTICRPRSTTAYARPRWIWPTAPGECTDIFERVK